jgi:hypothetical protein
MVPVARVIAIYARENGQGMAVSPGFNRLEPFAGIARQLGQPCQRGRFLGCLLQADRVKAAVGVDIAGVEGKLCI